MPDGDLLFHLDPDDLALAALGEPLSIEARDHISSCPSCSEELTDLARVVALGRSAGVDYRQIQPDASVWNRIQDGLLDVKSGPSTGSVTELSSKRSRSPRLASFPLLAAAVLGILLGAGLVAVVGAFQSEPTVLASAPLGPVPDGPAGPQTGFAEVSLVDGVEMLAITTNDLADPDGFHEVWLLNLDTGGMIAMGVVPAGSRRIMLPIPTGVDLSAYAAVDISDEPFDGNPAHSSVSVLRGDLTT
jgi:hypothetical protein